MARFYSVTVTAPTGTTGNASLAQTWSSVFNGQYDPGALNVEFDFVSTVLADPGGNCTITIWGVPLSLMQQAADFSGLNVAVNGGMFAPPGNQFQLIVPKQAGLILSGAIYQSWGNWQATEMNLNFVVVPSLFTFKKPGQFVFTWTTGQSLLQAITNTLNAAYSNPTIINQIGGTYTPQNTKAGISGTYKTLTDFSQFIKRLTSSSTSPGVDIAVQANGAILLFDQLTTPSKAVTVNFTDLIGQPTWVDVDVFQFTAVMRADIQVGSYVQMPVGLQSVPGIVTQSAAAFPGPLKYQTSLQGKFIVTAVRQVGNFRDADGTSWASIVQVLVPTAQVQNG